MANTKLLDPFIIRFMAEGTQYTARVIYNKPENSCSNQFEVQILEPEGYSTFNLNEKLLNEAGFEEMVWLDERGMESDLYTMIGNHITTYMKDNLGVVLMDTVRQQD